MNKPNKLDINWLSDKIYNDNILGAKLRYKEPTNPNYICGIVDQQTSFRVSHNWTDQSGGFGTIIGQGINKIFDFVRSFIRSIQTTAGEFGISSSSTLTGINLTADSTSLFKQYVGTENNIDIPNFTITFLPKIDDPTSNEFKEDDSPLSQLRKFLIDKPDINTEFKNRLELDNEKFDSKLDGYKSYINNVQSSLKSIIPNNYNNTKKSFDESIESIKSEMNEYNEIYPNGPDYLSNASNRKKIIDVFKTNASNIYELSSSTEDASNKVNELVKIIKDDFTNDNLNKELDNANNILSNSKINYVTEMVNNFVDNYVSGLEKSTDRVGNLDKRFNELNNIFGVSGLIGSVKMFHTMLIYRGPSNYLHNSPRYDYPVYLEGTYVLSANGNTYFNLLPSNIEVNYSKSRLWYNNKDYGPAWIKCTVSFTPAIGYLTRDIKYIMQNTYDVTKISEISDNIYDDEVDYNKDNKLIDNTDSLTQSNIFVDMNQSMIS